MQGATRYLLSNLADPTMQTKTIFTRLILATGLIASLGACTVVPAYPVPYRSPPAYVESYPTYGYSAPRATIYYEANRHHHQHGGHGYYRDHREYRGHPPPRRIESPLQGAARAHRDVRRSLGLPRLPGMP